jgi:hypothetical protein
MVKRGCLYPSVGCATTLPKLLHLLSTGAALPSDGRPRGLHLLSLSLSLPAGGQRRAEEEE